jgi:hypothetical protein
VDGWATEELHVFARGVVMVCLLGSLELPRGLVGRVPPRRNMDRSPPLHRFHKDLRWIPRANAASTMVSMTLWVEDVELESVIRLSQEAAGVEDRHGSASS